MYLGLGKRAGGGNEREEAEWRNMNYIFPGVRELKKEDEKRKRNGFGILNCFLQDIDYVWDSFFWMGISGISQPWVDAVSTIILEETGY